jgi:hypothetical protein
VRVEACGDVPNVTLVGDRLHVRPAGVEADTVRATVPVKPPVAVTVIVEVPEPPASIWVGVTALAAIAKVAPVEVTVTVTVRASVPLVPDTVTLKLIAVVQPAVNVDVLGVGSVTLVGDSVAVHPDGTVDVTVRLIVPVKPLIAFAVIVDVPVFGAV